MEGGEGGHGTFAPVALTSGRPPVERWLLLIIALVVLAVIKPWGSAGDLNDAGPPGVAQLGGVGAGSSGLSLGQTSPPSPGQRDRIQALGVSFCLESRLWLVASVERWRDQHIRVWRAMEPAVGPIGPEDSTIPIVSVVSDGVTELGWCAPTVGADASPGSVDITVWRRSASIAAALNVESSRPASRFALDRSSFGDLYRPPTTAPSPDSEVWPSGTYVFRYRRDGQVRWFGVEVETRPARTPAP